jgi:hypothetical protein
LYLNLVHETEHRFSLTSSGLLLLDFYKKIFLVNAACVHIDHMTFLTLSWFGSGNIGFGLRSGLSLGNFGRFLSSHLRGSFNRSGFSSCSFRLGLLSIGRRKL